MDAQATLAPSTSLRNLAISPSDRLVVPICAPPIEIDSYVIEEHRVKLHGYELHAVEQWILDRQRVPIIVIYTGDPKDVILADVYGPAPREKKLKEAKNLAFESIKTVGARPKETSSNGTIFVTPSTSLAPSLNLVRLPSPAALHGTVQRELTLNINLRRLGCGGRAGLSLSKPTAAQQDKLLNMYQLQTGIDSHEFAENVLGLIGLVHKALALFGLGPLAKELADTMRVANQRSRAAQDNLLQGSDGLLCDQTLHSLDTWLIEFAEPLMRLPHSQNENSNLAPYVLAALISIVVATRRKMEDLKVHALPKDPFEQRHRFLLAIRDFKSSYSSSPFLDVSCILQIRHQASTKTSVRRALKSKLEDVLSPNLHDEVKEEETSDVYALAAMIKGGSAAEVSEIQALWAGHKRSHPVNRRRGSDRDQDTSDTENERRLTGLGLIKGMGERAGRAGRRLAGLPGFLDKSQGRATPDLYLAPGEDESKLNTPLLRSRRGSTEEAMRPFRKYSLDMPSQEDLQQYRLSSTALARLAEVAPEEENNRFLRPVALRRNVTDHGGALEDYRPRSDIYLDDVFDDDDLREESIPYRHRDVHRRHSYTNIELVEGIPTLHSRERLKMDVELTTMVRTLRAKKRRLQQLVKALESTTVAYQDSISKVGVHYREKKAQLEDLKAKANALLSMVDSPASPISPAFIQSTLEEGEERIKYAQQSVTDRLVDVKTSETDLDAAVGKEGSLRTSIDKGHTSLRSSSGLLHGVWLYLNGVISRS